MTLTTYSLSMTSINVFRSGTFTQRSWKLTYHLKHSTLVLLAPPTQSIYFTAPLRPRSHSMNWKPTRMCASIRLATISGLPIWPSTSLTPLLCPAATKEFTASMISHKTLEISSLMWIAKASYHRPKTTNTGLPFSCMGKREKTKLLGLSWSLKSTVSSTRFES